MANSTNAPSHPSYAEILKDNALPQTEEEKAAPLPPQVEPVFAEQHPQRDEKVVVLDEQDAGSYLHPGVPGEDDGKEETHGKKKGANKKKEVEKEYKGFIEKVSGFFTGGGKTSACAAISLDLAGIGALSAYLLNRRQTESLTNRSLYTCTALAGILLATTAIVYKKPKVCKRKTT
ncbi:Schizosaccharomyces specific protein [Schizosaccharomyces osmophilus]|uniref:Schizosaccharomyces specific protein n=1 Tax=Schizosaccharomyces osmophilus TaxID=2545709 RepID=A0AAE9WAC7_9SCHI|nr:Schizosaccharomyces specific protein [Schizosaccharomyces osmophilus]WBW72298.1 Schizosaccharomyces specific protein [Schizosaccharomyces osmophilus]